MKKLTTAAFLIFLIAAISYGQGSSGITGVVTDPNGAVVAGAEVKLTDTKTGKEHTTTTNEQGVYSILAVTPGTGYKLTISAQGFNTSVIANVALGVSTIETHNVELTIGSISNTVVVTSAGEATLNTVDASIGNVIDQRRLIELPTQLRNSPAALIGLQPGVVGSNVGTTTTNRVGSVTGSRADQGNITVDGIDANDQATGQFAATTGNAPIDAIQEFRTVTTNPSASEGRSSGGQVELVTKSGTNSFHGSLREYNRTAATAANSFFNNRARVARPQLTRNQFGGSLGGPVIKDRLFFFFDYEGRRDAQGVSYLRIVPLDHFRNGSLAFLNNTPGCASNSRLNTAPNCITIINWAEVALLDPKRIGPSQELQAFINSRYPHANDLTAGDGVNTGGFRFNAPSHRADNTYTTRIDGNLTSKQKIFGRFNIARRVQTDTVNTVAQQFPGDPEAGQIIVHDYAWAVGDTWTLTPTLINQLTVGVSRSGLLFPKPVKTSAPNLYAANSFGPLTAPFAGFSDQDRFVSVPTLRDDVTWTRSSHTISFGGSFKPIDSKTGIVNDYNFPVIGLGGLLTSLDSTLRPATIGSGTTRSSNYDAAFTFLLGTISQVGTNFNYDVNGTPLALGTGKHRDYRYDELELYGQDSWRLKSDLTLTAGVRWQYYPAPYEKNGFQAGQDVGLDRLLNLRVQNNARGVSGDAAEPFLRYDLIGKGNNGRALYEPDLNNFAPRLSFAYNPTFKNGLLKRILGDRRTVIRGGGSVVYDRPSGGITFIQDQVSYLFDNSPTLQFPAASPTSALLISPRFTSIAQLPVQNTPPVINHPATPFVDGTTGTGLATGEFNYAVDQQFKIPYSIEYSFGFQRELPGNFLLDVSYVGRQGRQLFSQADLAQILDFKDPASGQMMLAAFNALQSQVQAGLTGAAITKQPWFENQIGAGGTALMAGNGTLRQLVLRGDTSDAIQLLYAVGLLDSNVAMSSQFGTNIYVSNQGASSYNGMLVSLRKRLSRGLQFDFNYTLSNSIDNGSSVVNSVAGGLVCDLRNLKVCRGPSDFDIRHLVNANWIYELPFGKGRRFLGQAPGWADAVIGGWEVTGIYTYRSGLPFGTTTTAFPVGFNFNSPGVLNGDPSALRVQIHDAPGGTIQFFGTPTAVFDATKPTAGALRFPHHGEIGNRNLLRGPGFWNVDAALLKNFRLPWSESQRLQLRWETYNVFNHNVFNVPAAAQLNIVASSFGQVTTSASAPREMQFALRWEF